MARWRPTPHLDPSELERGIDRATLRRAWAFARPYRGLLGLQLAGLAATAVMGILPPLVLKALVDRAVAHRLSTGGVNVLVAAAVAIALTMTGLGLLNRWLGSRIGEGLIYDLRVALLALLVVPGFVLLDRRMAKRLATLSRQRMSYNADMSSTMAERLNVAG